MSDPVTNELLLEVLKKLQGDVGEVKRDIKEVKARLSAQDDHIRGMMTSIGILTGKTDDLADRLGRVEQRLGLVEV